MPNQHQALNTDSELSKVQSAISAMVQKANGSHVAFWGQLVRQSLDEVIDGPRTGRWALSQLSPTEQTYVGTKVEILVQSELSLEDGRRTDVSVDGTDVDIKWSRTLQWQIGPENVGKICLGLGLGDKGRSFSVGIFRAHRENLRRGRNRDGKTALSAQAVRNQVVWLVRDGILPVNFLAELPSDIRARILAGKSAQERIRLLAELVPETPIPRLAFETVARDKRDPMRRLRRDASRSSPLGDMVLLSRKYCRKELLALGFHNVPADHWVSVHAVDLARAGF